MDSNPSLNRQSFEAFLANAFEVQQSGLEAQSLSAIVDVQRFLATPEFNADRALPLIAERALKIANASGIAIALLEANQLVYRAGSGSAAIEIGRHVPAVFAARSEVQAEILRVENAYNDSRVQAEICKQFGATSLLILPVYHKQVITGVLQVHFNEAHVFLEREVRAYRIMAGLVDEAITHELQGSREDAAAKQAESVVLLENITSAPRVSSEGAASHAADNLIQVLTESAANFANFGMEWVRRFVEMVERSFGKKIWPIAATIGTATLLAIAIQNPEHHDAASSKLNSPAVIESKTGESLPPASVVPGEIGMTPSTKTGVTHGSAFRRVQVGPNEVDYVADDVTIRKFGSHTAPRQLRGNERRVEIGEDVTIRYFSNASAVDSHTAPVPASQTAKESLSK